jgi:small-conductance mechanosensitive channel
MRLRVWIQNPKEHPGVRHRLNVAVIKAFREHGIEIPYPQRDLNFRNALPEANQS